MQQQLWAGVKNGTLLSRAEAAGFPVLVTGDQSLQHQQNFTGRTISVLVMCAASNALEDSVPLVPMALRAIAEIQPGTIARVFPD